MKMTATNGLHPVFSTYTNAAEVKSDTPPPSSSSGGLLQNEKSPLDDFRRQRDAEATADDNVHS